MKILPTVFVTPIKKEIGTISIEKAQELLDGIEDKKVNNITKRGK